MTTTSPEPTATASDADVLVAHGRPVITLTLTDPQADDLRAVLREVCAQSLSRGASRPAGGGLKLGRDEGLREALALAYARR